MPKLISDDITATIQQYYDDPKYSGYGRDRLFKVISVDYANITRRQIAAFLDRQTDHQLRKPILQHRTIKPIIVEAPNVRWQADLIDMSKYKGYNNQYKYLLTVIDCFSKYAFVRGLTSKKAAKLRLMFEDIFNTNFTRTNTYPKLLHTDNGGEFKNATIKEMCDAKNIKQVFGTSHKAQSQGIVERFNKTISNMITAYFVKHNTFNWRTVLPQLVEGYNSTWHSTTKNTPEKLHHSATTEQIEESANNLRTKANNSISVLNEGRFPTLHPGDDVRIAKFSSDPKVRARAKKKLHKPELENWSREIYQVRTISRAKNAAQKSYTLMYNGAPYTVNGSAKRYYRDQLLRVS